MGQAGQNAATRYGAGKELETAAKESQACHLRATGLSFDQIATALGYNDRAAAFKAVQRGYASVRHEGADELRVVERERHNLIVTKLWEIVDTDHVAHNNGRIVLDLDGRPILDNGPKIAALNALLKASERLAKREGLDAPTQLSVSTIDSIDAQIIELEREHERVTRGRETSQAVPATGTPPADQ
jgi:hypothetical protein